MATLNTLKGLITTDGLDLFIFPFFFFLFLFNKEAFYSRNLKSGVSVLISVRRTTATLNSVTSANEVVISIQWENRPMAAY